MYFLKFIWLSRAVVVGHRISNFPSAYCLFFFFLITDGPQKRLPCTVQVTSGGAAPGIPTTSLVRKRG